MKLIVCALYIEAKPFIHHYKLKPIPSPSGIQVFKNKNLILVISGTSKVASACATTYALTKFSDIQNTINIGLCGSFKHTIGTLLSIDQILDHDTQRSFYPDIHKSDIQRESIVTVSRPITDQKSLVISHWGDGNNRITNFDMEAAGFYEAASNFLHTHQIHILKIVSDHGCTGSLNKETIETILKDNSKNIADYIDQRTHTEKQILQDFSQDDIKLIEICKKKNKLSVSQFRELKKLLWNIHIQSQKNIKDIIQSIENNKTTNILASARDILKDL